MVDKTLIDNFYRDVENLRLKFPVAAISIATGLSKGVISEVLNRKRDPSENLIRAFNEKFSKGSTRNIEAVGSGIEILTQAILNLTESNRILASNNERLVTMLEANSSGSGSASQLSQEKNAVRHGPVEQSSAFVGKSEIVVDQKTKKKKGNEVSEGK